MTATFIPDVEQAVANLLDRLAAAPERLLEESRHSTVTTHGGKLRFCRRGCPWQSPIVRWLRRQLFADRRVRSFRLTWEGEGLIFERSGDALGIFEVCQLPLPPGLVLFERNFQEGKYASWLEVK